MPLLFPRPQLLPAEDASLDALRAERRAQFGASIAHVKAQVGPGTEYANEAARAVMSAQGGWFELRELPEEFAGATGAGVSHRLLSRPQIGQTLARWNALREMALRDGGEGGGLPWRKLSLYALYEGGSLQNGQGVFVLDCTPGRPVFTAGAWQPDAVPRAVKICLHADTDPALAAEFGLPVRGVQVFLVPAHTDNGGALLATLSPSPGSADLSIRPASPTAH